LDGINTAIGVSPNKGAEKKEAAREIIEKPAACQQNQHAETSAPAITQIVTTFITEPTKIQGSIITDSNIEIAEEIQGNIDSKNTVTVTGNVHGDIKC